MSGSSKIIIHILALVVGIASYLYLFSFNWKVALAILGVVFANNLSNNNR